VSADKVTVIVLLAGQLAAVLLGIWRASAWVQRIEDRLWYLEKFSNGLHDPPGRRPRGPRDRA
jgi:hypothetical protein